jgi:hypothetical protein
MNGKYWEVSNNSLLYVSILWREIEINNPQSVTAMT